MRISDWSSDVCSSDLQGDALRHLARRQRGERSAVEEHAARRRAANAGEQLQQGRLAGAVGADQPESLARKHREAHPRNDGQPADRPADVLCREAHRERSEEQKSELQSLMRISYAVFCLKKKNNKNNM